VKRRVLYFAALVLASLVAALPAQAAVAQTLVLHTHTDAVAGTTAWSSDGAFVDAGNFNDDSAFFAGSSATYHVVRTFIGADGTFTVVANVRVLPTADPGILNVTGPWSVQSGTGAYAGLTGAGVIKETFDTSALTISGTWTGHVQLR
jgi:hypothetical protein